MNTIYRGLSLKNNIKEYLLGVLHLQTTNHWRYVRRGNITRSSLENGLFGLTIFSIRSADAAAEAQNSWEEISVFTMRILGSGETETTWSSILFSVTNVPSCPITVICL